MSLLLTGILRRVWSLDRDLGEEEATGCLLWARVVPRVSSDTGALVVDDEDATLDLFLTLNRLFPTTASLAG